MRLMKVGFVVAMVLTAHAATGSAQTSSPREIKTEMQLEGHCAKLFGRTRFTYQYRDGALHPIAPVIYQGLPSASCTVTLKVTDGKTSEPVAGVTARSSRLLSTGSYGTKTQRIGSVQTDKNGVARFKFRWDESSCGVEFGVSDPNDKSQSLLSWPFTLLTRDAFFQINKCQGTFIAEGLSREDICNGEPKNQ